LKENDNGKILFGLAAWRSSLCAGHRLFSDAPLMGFDFDRIEVQSELDAPDALELLSEALHRNLTAERSAINSYRHIAALATADDEAALRLVKVVLAAEEEHAQILSTVMESLNQLRSQADLRPLPV
jgi:hypothetical protein